MIDPQRFYTVSELRTEARAPRQMIYEALESGELRAIRRGRRWLIPGRSVISWLATAAIGGRGSP
jgi:excisionase family DNA binding protein